MSYDPDQSTIDEFVKCAKQGYCGFVTGCLAKGMPVDILDDSGMTALFAAASAGKEDVITVLVAAGADVNYKLPRTPPSKRTKTQTAHLWGRTALNAAAEHAHSGALHLLLDYGADPRLLSDAQQSAAHYVIANADRWLKHADGVQLMKKALERIFNYGVLATQTNSSGSTLLHEAVRKGCPDSILDLLLARGARINASNSQHVTPLLAAASTFRRADALRWLVEHGADVNGRDALGRTALFNASGAENVAALIDLGIDVDRLDAYGQTALLHRLSNQPPNTNATPEVLLILGTDTNIELKDHEGKSAKSVITSRRMNDLKPLVAARAAKAAMRKRMPSSLRDRILAI